MNTTPFPSRQETRQGFCFWAIQLLVLPSLLQQLNAALAFPLGDAGLNFLFYIINFLCVSWIFRRFIKDTLVHSVPDVPGLLKKTGIWLAVYLLCSQAVSTGIQAAAPAFANHNNDAVIRMFQQHPLLIAVGTIVLVPPVEEFLFRELVFHSLLKRNRYTAIAVSSALFSAVHLAGFLGQYSPLMLALAFLQYLPAGICLSMCYLHTGTLLGPMLMHSLINAVSILLLL